MVLSFKRSAEFFIYIYIYIYIYKEEQKFATELTGTDFTVWRVVPAPCGQLYKPNMDVPVVYYPSLIILDTILMYTMTQYCSYEHHIFEAVVENHAM